MMLVKTMPFWFAFGNNYSSIGLIILHVIPFIK